MHRSTFLGLALACSALTPLPVLAQTTVAPPAAAETESVLSEIVITGSNVIRNGYQAPTPVTAVTTQALEAAQPGRLGDAIAQLPQFLGSPSSKNVYQPTLGLGGSTLSLRNLGSNRTLVLVDGRRLVPNTTRGDYSIDVIPAAVVERVDIVTGGASAQYGSDAVGGVVNLILKDKLDGFQGLLQGGVSKYNDGGSWKVELTQGLSFGQGRGRAILSYAHDDYDEIASQHDRPWGRSDWGIVTVAGATPRVQILPSVQQVASFGGAITTGPLAGTQFLPGGVTAPFNLGNPRSAAAAAFSDGTNMAQPIQAGLKSDTFFGRFTYDLTDEIQLFADGAFVRGRTFFNQGYAIFNLGATPITIFSGNPYIPANLQTQMTAQNIASFQINRVNRDLGYTFADLLNKTTNVSAGIKGEHGGWQYGASASFGENDGDYLVTNNVDATHLYAAADAVRDPASGRIVCRTDLTHPGLYPGCVPINVLGDGSPSPAARDYVVHDMPYSTLIKQEAVSAYLRGEPFSTWAGPVALGVGGEYRHQSLDQKVDAVTSSVLTGTGIRGFPANLVNRVGGLMSLNPQAAAGKVNVKEVYGEVLIPLAKDLPWAQSLDLNAAVRYTDYSTSGGVTTWKLGATYQPVSDVRFRATYSKDIRAPNLGELYASGSSAQTQITDPVQGGRSYIVYSKGTPSPNLDPESGRTYSLGAVLTPTALPGFAASIDYYHIKIDGLIGTLSPQQTIDACAAGSAFNCSVITRGGPTNDILIMNIPNQNLSKLTTAGLDLDLSYTRDLYDGTLRLRAVGSYVDKWVLQAPGARAINYAGEVQERLLPAYSNPRFTGSLSADYQRGPFGLIVRERMISKNKYDATFREGIDINDNSVPAVFYTDLTLQYRFDALTAENEAFLTINNLFNKAPPLFPVGSSILPSYYPRTLYDGVGRYFTVGLRVRM